MDPELKKILEETHALAKDNHKMLRAIRRDQWLGFIGKIIVWAIVLAVPLFLYQRYFEPIISDVTGTASTTPSGLFGLPTSAETQKLINYFKAGH
ncbi:MAG TPA: hypothetical protein VMV38_00570 [Candidatus Paceibacterota bacterium]|nr:hypothetical protein [Candidatus Paceibacterota bacterium]